MKDGKLKRILALSGVLLLVGMYLLTLVFAFVDPTAGKNWLKALRRFTKKSRMGTLQKPWSMINMQVMIDNGIPTSGSIKSQAESAMTGRR